MITFRQAEQAKSAWGCISADDVAEVDRRIFLVIAVERWDTLSRRGLGSDIRLLLGGRFLRLDWGPEAKQRGNKDAQQGGQCEQIAQIIDHQI